MKKRLLASLLSLCLLVGLFPTAALAAEDTADEAAVVCMELEGCIGDAHDEDCPLYVAPNEDESSGEDDSADVPGDPDADPVYDNGDDTTVIDPEQEEPVQEPTPAEQLAELIADLPDPSEIDPLDEEQVEAVYNQISAIYAFAGENGFDDIYDNETINAVIAAAWPAEPLVDVTAITSDGGSLASGEYQLTGDITLTTDLTIPANAEVTVDLNGHTLTGSGSSSVITVYGKLTLKDSKATGPQEIADTSNLPSEVYTAGSDGEDRTFTAKTITNSDGSYTTYYSVSGLGDDGELTTTYYSYTSGIITGGGGQEIISGAEKKLGGGGIYVCIDGSVVMESGQIALNDLTDKNITVDEKTQENEGGGVFVDGNSNSQYGSFTLNGGAISGNEAGNGLGGGLSVFGKFVMSGGVVSGNEASGSGGGIRVWGSAQSLYIEDGYICNNSGKHGGGLNIGIEGATVQNAVISGNRSSGTEPQGAGIFAAKTVSLKNISVTGNTGARLGGGIRLGGGGSISDSVIAFNSATTGGGGIYFLNGTANISGSTIIGNEVSGNTNYVYGGGIYCDKTVLTANGLTISNNKITCNSNTAAGGGICLINQGTQLKIADSTISGNHAIGKTAQGGGICAVSGQSLTVENCSIESNEAVATKNARGGGIDLAGSVKAEINGTGVTGNKASISADSSETSVSVYGGGITVFSSNDTEIINTNITNNCAEKPQEKQAGYGGGLYICATDKGKKLTITESTVSGNSACIAAIWAEKGTLILNDTMVVDNTGSSTEYGAIRVSNSTGAIEISGSTVVYGNKAGSDSNEKDRNIYLFTDQTITLSGPLTAGATIGVTTQTTPTSDTAVQITAAETGTKYYENAAQYFIADTKATNGTYLTLADTNNAYVKLSHTTETYYKVTLELENITTTDSLIQNIKSGTLYATTVIAAEGYTLPTEKPSDVDTYNISGTSASVRITSVSKNTTIKLSGVANTYTVAFNANGGSGDAMSSQSMTYDKAETLTENTYTKTGYNFAGWSKTENGSCEYPDKASVQNLTAENGTTVTLYAVWTAKKVIEKFDDTNATQSHTYDGGAKSYTLKSELEGFEITYKQGDKEVSNPENVGTYDVVITRDEDKTYAAFEQTISGGLVITAADYPVSITANGETSLSMTGSSTVTLTVTSTVSGITVSGVTCSDDTIEVKPNSNGTYSVTLPNTTKTYTFTATVKGDTSNYGDGPATCTVSVTRRSSGGGGSSSGNSSSSSYTVTVDSAKNGTVSISPKSASKGATVTVTVKPNSGYELDDLTVTDKNGDTVRVKSQGSGKYTFTMPASKVTVEASFTKIMEQPKVSFVDVPTSAYYYDAVAWAVENGVTAGTSAATFSPNAACTRAQAVTFLWRAAGSPAPKSSVNPFADVPASAYYYDAVLWAVEQGITAGTSAATFSPDATCTRGQIVTFLHRADGTAATGSNPFTDVADNAYYVDAVKWAVAESVTAGTSATTFSPDASCTRAQIVTFLYRAYA